MIAIHRSRKAGQYYFTAVAANGRTLATSELYKSVAGLNKGIRAAIAAAQAGRFVYLIAANQQRYWVLRAANHKVILTSETYHELRKSRHGATVCQQALLSGRYSVPPHYHHRLPIAA